VNSSSSPAGGRQVSPDIVLVESSWSPGVVVLAESGQSPGGVLVESSSSSAVVQLESNSKKSGQSPVESSWSPMRVLKKCLN
jgi:hypothetical protein